MAPGPPSTGRQRPTVPSPWTRLRISWAFTVAAVAVGGLMAWLVSYTIFRGMHDGASGAATAPESVLCAAAPWPLLLLAALAQHLIGETRRFLYGWLVTLAVLAWTGAAGWLFADLPSTPHNLSVQVSLVLLNVAFTYGVYAAARLVLFIHRWSREDPATAASSATDGSSSA